MLQPVRETELPPSAASLETKEYAPSQRAGTQSAAGRQIDHAVDCIIAANKTDDQGLRTVLLDEALHLLHSALDMHPSLLEAARANANIGLIYLDRSDLKLAMAYAVEGLNRDAGVLTSWMIAAEAAIRSNDHKKTSMILQWGENALAWDAPLIADCLRTDPDCARLARVLPQWRAGVALQQALAEP